MHDSDGMEPFRAMAGIGYAGIGASTHEYFEIFAGGNQVVAGDEKIPATDVEKNSRPEMTLFCINGRRLLESDPQSLDVSRSYTVCLKTGHFETWLNRYLILTGLRRNPLEISELEL